LVFIGRIDDQVKIRGFRIELGEIESHLSKCVGVVSCVVIAREDQPGQKRLVAYLVRIETKDKDEAKIALILLDSLKKTLPDYMLPSAFIVLEALPLTSNGKVDKKALPAPDGTLLQAKYVAPNTETERVLCKIWQQLLSLESVGVSDNFFHLGGHSLLIFKLLRIINENCGVELQIRDLISRPYIQELAKIIDTSGSVSGMQSSQLQSFTRDDDTLPTLYCVPGAGGLSLIFSHLAQQACGRFNVKAFQYQGLLDDNQPHDTIAKLVEYFLEVLLSSQSKEPFILLGHSFGGVIAYELVRSLNEKGFAAQLILVDSRLYNQSFGDQPIQSAEQISTMNSLLATKQAKFFLKDVDDKTLDKMKNLFELHAQLMEKYIVNHKIDSDILNIHTPQSFTSANKKQYVKQLQSLTQRKIYDHCIEGGHYSILMGKSAMGIIDAFEEHFGKTTKGSQLDKVHS